MSKEFTNYIHSTHSFEYLTLEKEKLLAQKAKEGCQKSREQLVNSHLRLVINIAKQFCYQHNPDFQDLVQEGNLGILYAIDNFDPQHNNRFSLYAKAWVHEFIKRKHYKNMYLLSTPFRVVQKSFGALSEKKELDPQEKKEGENIAIEYIVKKPYYLGDYMTANSENTLENSIKDHKSDFSQIYEEKNYILYMKKMIKRFCTEQEQFVLSERFFKEPKKASYKEIAAHLKLSAETIRNIEKSCIAKLSFYIKKI